MVVSTNGVVWLDAEVDNNWSDLVLELRKWRDEINKILELKEGL